MPIIVPDFISVYLVKIDQAHEPVDEVALFGELSQQIPKDTIFTQEEKIGLWAEVNAFRFSSPYNRDRAPWGTYFMPMGSGELADGTIVYFPDATEITQEILEYWKDRAYIITHPTIKARYGDLSWEFSKIVSGSRRDNGLAAVAIDAYLSAISTKITTDEHQEWRFANRAIELSIETKDSERLVSSKNALFDVFRRHNSEGKKFMWWQLADLALNRKGLALADAERQEIIDGLEQALVTCSDTNNAERFDPHLATCAATRLADYYNQHKKGDDGKRVVLAAGKVFENASIAADGMVAIAWLEDVMRKYRAAGLTIDAVRVEGMIRQRSEDAKNEMKRISTTIEIDRDEYEKSLSQLVEGNLVSACKRIALSFLCSQSFVQETLQEQLSVAPFTSHINISIPHPHGFTAAVIGSIKDDLEGRAVHQSANVISLNNTFLHHGFERLKQEYNFSAADILAFLFESEMFIDNQKVLIESGITAWLEGDNVKAIHLLVPQVEAVLRNIARAMGMATVRPDVNSGGFEAIGMGSILRNDLFKRCFETNARHHLIALYADPRGHNLRNDLAHGLIGHERLSTTLANWVVHSLLLLAILRVSRS